MAVYVDDARNRYGRMKMCHMVADTRAELLEMADRVGVARKWLQNAGTHREHFDVALSKRALAVELGAQQVSTRDIVLLCRARAPKKESHGGPSLDGRHPIADGAFRRLAPPAP